MTYQLSRGGQLYGPYTLQDLQQYVATGNVMPDDLVKSEAEENWVSVEQVLNLGNLAPPSSPFASTPIWQTQLSAAPEVPTVQLYPLFPVSKTKFVVMSLCTLGLYQVYWTYKNWVRIKAKTGESIIPWARALFLGIWDFSLFSRIADEAASDEIPVGWNSIVLGFGVLMLAFASRLPWGLAAISVLSFVPYLPVIGTVSELNAKRRAITVEPPNDSFSGWNIAGMVFGGLFMLLALIGWLSEAVKHFASS
jgi:hypothetical protein